MALEDEVKTGKDYVSEEAKQVLREKIRQKVDGNENDTTLNRTLYDTISMLTRCWIQDLKHKEKDYELALALCTHYQYPKNIMEDIGFAKYYQRKNLSEQKAEQQVKQFLRL